MKISIIAAISSNGVIGDKGDLLWRLPNDMAFFKMMTMGHTVVMGRKTYESIPEKYRPLPGRNNFILTKNEEYSLDENVQIFIDIDAAIECAEKEGEKELFVCGGGEIYKEFLDHADNLYITEVNTVVDGDTKFPKFDMEDWKLVWHGFCPEDDKNPYDHHFYKYERKKKDG